MRLLDRLLSDGFDVTREGKPHIIALLKKSQLVLADNVAKYCLTLDTSREVVASDFPCVLPPFELTFIEMKIAYEKASEFIPESEVGNTFQSISQGSIGNVDICLLGFTFVQFVGRRMPVLMSKSVLPIAKDGTIVPQNSNGKLGLGTKRLYDFSDMSEENNKKLCSSLVSFYLPPTLLTLSFMNCRNVAIKEERPPVKLSKKHQKRTGRPLVSYKLLQIDHMKQVLEREGGASRDGLKKALHICRGHFSTYGKDGKGLLFGKYVATVWVPMHTRGSGDQGVVVKDYEVE